MISRNSAFRYERYVSNQIVNRRSPCLQSQKHKTSLLAETTDMVLCLQGSPSAAVLHLGGAESSQNFDATHRRIMRRLFHLQRPKLATVSELGSLAAEE